jgi:arylsulfatase A-like enzyme
MRVNTSRVMEEHHYGDYLRAAGYYTGYFGKYLNPPAMDPYCHNKSTPLPGWDEFYGMCVTAYYNVPWVNSDGNLEFTGTAPSEYVVHAYHFESLSTLSFESSLDQATAPSTAPSHPWLILSSIYLLWPTVTGYGKLRPAVVSVGLRLTLVTASNQ